MEKHIIGWSYWLGMVSLVLGFITRALNFLGTFPGVTGRGGQPITYQTFLDGAFLLFLTAIATWCYTSFKSHKPQG